MSRPDGAASAAADDDVHPDDIKAYERAVARLRRAAEKLKG